MMSQPFCASGTTPSRPQLGRIAEARAQAEAGLALNPGFTIRRFHEQPDCDNPIYLEQRHNIYEGLRKAGVSEE